MSIFVLRIIEKSVQFELWWFLSKYKWYLPAVYCVNSNKPVCDSSLPACEDIRHCVSGTYRNENVATTLTVQRQLRIVQSLGSVHCCQCRPHLVAYLPTVD